MQTITQEVTKHLKAMIKSKGHVTPRDIKEVQKTVRLIRYYDRKQALKSKSIVLN